MFRSLMGERPTILVTGHFGNFELAGFATGLFGVPSTTIARERWTIRTSTTMSRVFDRWVASICWIKRAALCRCKTSCKRRELLPCWRTNTPVPKDAGLNLGQPASCHKALALFVLTSGAEMVVAYNRRLDRPLRFELGCTGMASPDQSVNTCRRSDRDKWYKPAFGRSHSHGARAILVGPSSLARSTRHPCCQSR